MIIREYSQVEIASRQIDTACQIFLSGEDSFAALTLAGAGEEILGKILSKRGLQNSLESSAEAFALIKEIHTGTKPDQSESIKVLNRARNGAKHVTLSKSDAIQMDPKFEADNMIHRAISNYAKVTKTYTQQMIAFLNVVRL